MDDMVHTLSQRRNVMSLPRLPLIRSSERKIACADDFAAVRFP